SVSQAVAADTLVVTKTDLADAAGLERRLAHLNPLAEIVEAVHGEIEPALLFAERSTPRELETVAVEHGHDDVQALCLVFDEPLDWTAFGIWLTMLLQARGLDILRVKGLLDVGGLGPVLLNGVQHAVHPPVHLEKWPDEDRRSRL